MPLITAELEDGDFQFDKFTVDTEQHRYTFELNDVTNDEYDALFLTPRREFMEKICRTITRSPKGEDEPAENIEPGDLPISISANFVRLHARFLEELGTWLAT